MCATLMAVSRRAPVGSGHAYFTRGAPLARAPRMCGLPIAVFLVVLGRQAFAKFMAAPHYAYNAMKLPGPCGIITVHGDPDMAAECEAKGAELADAVIAAETNHADELAKYASRVNNDDPTILKKPN